MALDENNLPEGNGLKSSAISTVDQQGSGLSVSNTLQTLTSPRQGSSINQAAAQSSFSNDLATDPSIFSDGLRSQGFIDPNQNPEMYKTIYQSDAANAWNTLFNEMRTMRKSEVEDDLRGVRIQLAEYENAKDRADAFYAEGLVSKVEHSNILKQIEEGHLRGGKDKLDLVDQLIDGVMGGLSQALTAEDYANAVDRAQKSGLLKRTENLEKSYSKNTDTYQSLLEEKEQLKKDIEEREEETRTGGFASLFSGAIGRGDAFGAQGIPLPVYGGGDVEEDYAIRSKIEKAGGATALSSLPIFSKAFGLSDSWTGDEYFQYKAAEDAAGSISTFEGQVASIVGPAIIQTLEKQAQNKYFKGVKNPYLRTASALTQFATIVAGNFWSRNLETKMESGDAYWQKVDKLENALQEDLRAQGINRELTKSEKNNIAIMANDGVGDLKRKNMWLGGSDVMQFALTFMKLPGLSKAFTGTTLRNIAARELSSRMSGRLGINALKFSGAVGVSRELEGMEEGLQHKWVQDYLGTYGGETSGSFLNNQWNSMKRAGGDAIDYGLNMSGLRNSDPEMYESLAFKTAVQSGRDMATMMTGGGRTVSNWGGAKSLVELKQAMALLGEGGDNVNRKRLFEDKKNLMYKFFSQGNTSNLYDAIYRMSRKVGSSKTALMTRQEAIDAIHEVQQAEKIYNDVFDNKSPLAISGFGINYDIGRLGGREAYTEADKKKVFLNALDVIENGKRNKELLELQQSYREGKDESLDLYVTALTKEERAEYEDKNTTKKRKKELEDKLTAEGVSLEEKEKIKAKMEDRGFSSTPYDQELLENAEATEKRKKENEEIASEKKTWIGDPDTNDGALWNISDVEKVKALMEERESLMKKKDLTKADLMAIEDLTRQENQIWYEQDFEYKALERGRLLGSTKKAALIHGIGSIIQHIEKYGSKGLNKILPSILENNTKLDATTIKELQILANEVVTNRQKVADSIKDLKKKREELLFDAETETQHTSLTQQEKEELLELRELEEAGTLDEAQTKRLANLVARSITDKAVEGITEEITALEAEEASLSETAEMSEQYISRIESNPSDFLVNDSDFETKSDDTILEEAALEAAEGMDYIKDQLKNIPDFADVENGQRIYNQIKEREDIFRRRVVEAEDSRKDYFENIADTLKLALEDMSSLLETIKANAADRTAEQYIAEERMFQDALSSLGLNLEFEVDEGAVFENVGKIVLETVGQPALNVLKNSLLTNTDKVGVTLVLQGLLKSVLSDQSKVKTKLKADLKKISAAQTEAFTNIIKEKFEGKIAPDFYLENPKIGLKNVLHQISTLNEDKDLNNRDSALWKYVDHLSPHKLLEDIIKEDRTGLEASSDVIAELLMHHIFHLQAEKQLDILNSDINVTDQLENEKFVLQNKTIEFIPTKQQLQSIRELSVFLKSEIANKDTLTLGGVSSFLQGAAGTGKSKIVLPWAIQTAGIPNRAIYAFGHNPNSSATINSSLNLIKNKKDTNTLDSFLQLDDAVAEDLEVIIIDEAPSLNDLQYQSVEKQIAHINALKHANKKPAIKVVMLGDQAQLTNEVISPLEAFGTFKTMHTIITPITSIYRSDNPAIANFQDTFRRRKEDLSKTQLTVKLNSSHPWRPGAIGVYGVAGDFKERLILKLQNAAPNGERRVIITNPNKKEEYQSLIKVNQLKDVEVMSFIEAQGETIDEVYMDIVRDDMSLEDFNKALYTATSRAQNLIVATNLNIKNTIDPQLDAVQQGLGLELIQRREEFKTEVLENSKLLREFDELSDRETVHESVEEVLEEEPTLVDEFIDEAISEEDEARNEEQAAEEDKIHPETTRGEELDQDLMPEQAYDVEEDLGGYTENSSEEFDNNIDVSDKHVLFYPEYDALSSTTIRKSTVLPVMSDRPLSFVKGRAVSRDGKIISGIVILQEAREKIGTSTRFFEYDNKKVFRRIAVIGDSNEIDQMNFLTKAQKKSLKDTLSTGVSIPLGELGIPGDKSLVSDTNNAVSRNNIITGVAIPKGGARRLTYKYGSRREAHFTSNQPNSSNFLKQNKKLVDSILQKFIDSFYTESQPITDEQLKNIRQSRVKIFKKKDIKDLNVPEGFNIKSGRPYLVIKGVGNENKTQYIALTPRRISRNIKDDVKNYFQYIDAFGQAAAKIEQLSQGALKLGTKGFVDFIRGADKMAQDIAVAVGNVAAMEELIELRDVIRDLRWSEVDTNSNGSISKQTQGVGPAQAAMNKLAQSNSIFRVERRIKRNGKKVRIVTSKSLLSFASQGQTKGPITTQILETVFNSQDDKGYNHLLHLPLDIDMFNDLDSSGTSTTVRTAKQNHNAASKVLTSQLESIEGTKIILGKSNAVDEKRSKPKVTTTKKKKKKLRGDIGDINNLEGKEYREKSEDLKGSLISKNDANNLIKRLLPDLIATDSRGNEYLKPGNVVYLDALRMLELTESKNVLGKFIDQRIYLLEQKDGIYDNVIRHEVFHKIVAYYLKDSERKTLFQTARTQYNIPKSHTNAQVEERLAREFMKFRLDENSVVARIRKIFKKILKFLGFIDKNADNIEKLFTNIDNGYFAGSNMVGDPVSTNMNFESLTEQWESVEVYREARSRFIKGMDSLMSEYDDGQQDIISEVDYENSEVTGVPMGRDEALNYLVENNFPDFVQQLESKGLGNLNEAQSRIYKASKFLSDPRKARAMFKDVYQRDTLDEGYELEESLHLDNVNLSDVINDANLKDHSRNLSQSVIEVLTGISYTAANGKSKRLNIKHAYFQALQLLTNTYDPSITKMRANIKKKSKNLGNKLGTAGKAVEDAIIKLIDESFNTLNENNLHQIEIGKDRIKREILNEQLKNITGRTKTATAKRDKIREKIDNLDISDFEIPGNYHFVNQNKFIFSKDSNVIAADLLQDLAGQEQFSTIVRKKNESSEEFYFRIYTTLDAEGMAIPTEALIALYTKGKATRDLKNLIVNTASLREETFMLGDYTYEWDDSTKSSVKKIRYYRHKEFGTRATASSDIRNFINSNLKTLKQAAPGLLKSIKKASTTKDKMNILNKFMSLIQYPEDKVLIHRKYAEQALIKLEGFLQRLPDVGKMNKTAPKVESEKTGKMVYDTFTIDDLVNDEGSLLEALGNMLKVENEATKAHSIKNVEGKTIYAFHNSSYGVDIIKDLSDNKKPEHLQGEFYGNNIFVNGQSDIREMHDWDGIIDRKRKNIPVTYTAEGEKQWLDRNFNYYFLAGLKEAKQALYYTQQLTTVSDKSSPKSVQVKVLNPQQIKEAVTTMVEQYHKKSLKKSLVFPKILESTSLTKGQKVSRIIQELETRTDAMLAKIQSENILKNMDYSKAADQLNFSKLPQEKQLRALVNTFVSNYAINSFFLNQLVLGDTANFKDSYDVVKRMSIAFAPGYKGFVNPLLGMKKNFRVAVMEDPQATAFDFLSPKERTALVRDLKDLGLDSPIDLADGQGFVLPSRLKDLRRGFGGGFNPGTVMKPVYYGVDSTGKPTALKYSTTVLTESLVENHPGLKALKKQMELAEVDELVFKSGVKVGAPSTLSKPGYPKINPNTNFTTRPKIDSESILTLDNASLRLQLDPTADPNALVSNPTQLAYMINTNGLNSEAAADYYESMAELIDSGTKDFLMELGLMNSTGAVKKFLNLNQSRRNAIEKKIRAKIINAADTTESAHKEAEVLSAKDENGKPAVTINFPAVVNKIYQHLASSLSKATIKIKFPGSKLILQSAYGATIEDPVTGKQRPLKHITADRPYAEVLMPRIHSDKFKVGDSIYDNHMMGFRIPSTELHSSVSLKVVGFYDAHDTNVIIAPKELVTIHGSDFDVDSLFVIRKGHTSDKSKSGVSLYTNDATGLKTNNKDLLLTNNEVIPSSDNFIISVRDEVNYYQNEIRKLNSVMKLAEDNTNNREIKKDLKKTLEVLKRVEKAAVKNKMLDTYLDVIEDPKNRETILSPITMTNLKGRVKNGKDLDNSVFGVISEDMGLPILDNHAQLYGTKDLTNPLDEMYMHQSNQQGSKLTGSGANSMKALAYMMEASEGSQPSVLVDKKTQEGDILPFEFTIDGITYSRLNRYEKLRGDKKSKHTIWQTMDSVTNAAIDNSKEQILNILNLNQATASMFYVMIGTGVPLKTAVRIMLQPAVKEAARVNPKQFSKGASIVRKQILDKLGNAKSNTPESIQKGIEQTKLNTKSLKKGVLATSPRFNKSFDKQLGSTADSIFQLVILDLLSPEGVKKGLNKYGNDLATVASTLQVLQSLPSNHEDLTGLIDNMQDMFAEDSSFGFDLSNILNSLPHLQRAKDTAEILYSITSEILHVNNPSLKEFASSINTMIGSTSSSEDRIGGNERNKKIREEFVRFIASIVSDTKSIPPMDVKLGQVSTTIAGTQALSHRLALQVTDMKKKNTTNAFLSRVAVNRDKRGIQYISSNAAGITQEELVEVYADFNRLDPQLQEDILQYSIAKEGMLFAASNITMMIEPKRFAGYDQRRAKILAELIEDPKKLDVLKNRFAVQYALTNPNLLASTGNKKISETIVEENGSKYGTRKDRLSTGETVFYDLKINNDLGEGPLFLSNPNYNQVYIRVHQDVLDQDTKGFSYYQVIAKGSASTSFYTVDQLDLNTEYNLQTHFPKNALVRAVEDGSVDELILYKQIEGLEKGDKMVLRAHDDVLRADGIEVIISNVSEEKQKDKITEITSTVSKVTFEEQRTDMTPFIELPEIGLDDTKEEPAMQKVSDAQTISEEAAKIIVSRLERVFGFKAKVINRPDLEWAGKFVADVPIINIAYMRADTAFHEFAHPWVTAIFMRNKPLFNKLKLELQSNLEGQAILAKVKERYPNLKGDEFFKEAIVTAIGEYSAGMIDEQGKGLVDAIFELLKRIGNMIKKLWNSDAIITPEELTNMDLRGLALLLAETDARLETNITEFKNQPKVVTKQNFLKRLQGEGVISPGQVNGYYGIMDIVPGTTERRPDLFEKHAAMVAQYEQDYPGLIRRVGNDVVFNFDVPVEEFNANAEYQVIENDPTTDEKGFEKIVEEDTIKYLENARDVENVRLSDDEANYQGNSGVYKRLTHFVKTGVLGQSKDSVDAEYTAKKVFERRKRNIETDTILIENKPFTYKQLVDRFQRKSNNSAARGRAVHKLMEWLVTKDDRVLKDLREIQREKPDQDAITDASLKWVEQVGEGVLRKIGYTDTDKMKAELMLHSPILSIATQIDGLIQHEDGTLTMVDWKSGGYFLNDRSTAQMMRYSNGTTNDVSDSKLNKAMLELTLRAIMVKEHQPNAKFRQIMIHHLEKSNPFKQPFEVHVKDYLKIISNYLQAEKPEQFKALEEKGLLDANNYISQDMRNNAALDKYSHQPLEAQVAGLEKDIEILRTRIATPGMSNDLKSDKDLLEALTTAYLELNKTSKETLNSEGKLGDFKAWASSIYNINSPRLQAFNKIFRRASQKSQNKIENEKQIAEKLFKDVRDEFMKNNPAAKVTGLATLGTRSGFDYKGLYDFAFEEKLDGVQTPGVYMISLEDAKTKYDKGELTDAQYKLIKHLRETWNANWSELMDKKMESGNPYSKIVGMHNVENSVIEGKLHPNFMPRLPMESSEAYERHRGEGFINRQVKGSWKVLTNFAANTFSLFIEQNYYGQTDSINAHIPVRFMGSTGIIADSVHSFNLENMHYEFTANLMRKQEMDFVVALGDGLKSFYNTMKDLKGNDDKGWKNYEKFMENFIINSVMQERTAGRNNHWSSKQYNIVNPFYDPNKPTSPYNKQSFQFSLFKLMMAVKHITTGKALWFKFIGGTFNGAIILMYTTMKAVQGSVAKRLGYDPGVIDVTTSQLLWAGKEVAKYFGDQILRSVTNEPSNNKLHNLLKRFKYLPDNYDYAVDKSDMMNLKNPTLTYDKLFFFHAIHEEWGHALLLAAQMKNIKMADGSSIWDSYNDDGTFMKVKNGKANVRGVITDPSGVKRVIGELTEDEINKMLKMSTDIHGAYRTHERTVLESTAVGVWAMQFKKYLPALLIQEMESRKDDVYMGKYEALTDEKGNKIKTEVEIDGQMVEMDAMDWVTWQHEGRAKLLLKVIASMKGGQYTNYKYSNLNERDKYDLLGILSKFAAFSLLGLAMSTMDDDDYPDPLMQRMEYLQKDALQGLMPGELLRTLKNPFAVIAHANSIIESDFSISAQRKNIPFLSIAHELERYGMVER